MDWQKFTNRGINSLYNTKSLLVFLASLAFIFGSKNSDVNERGYFTYNGKRIVKMENADLEIGSKIKKFIESNAGTISPEKFAPELFKVLEPSKKPDGSIFSYTVIGEKEPKTVKSEDDLAEFINSILAKQRAVASRSSGPAM